jgi:hypothetical protein
MPSIHEQAVELIAAGKTTVGKTRVQQWDGGERTARAAKIWAICWGLGAVSVLIPVAHFLLVPAFFVAGPVAAYSRWRRASAVAGGEGACPSCGASLPIAANADEWPLFQLCEACRTSIRIEKRL